MNILSSIEKVKEIWDNTFLSFLKESDYLFRSFHFAFLVKDGQLVRMGTTFRLFGIWALRIVFRVFNDRLSTLLNKSNGHCLVVA